MKRISKDCGVAYLVLVSGLILALGSATARAALDNFDSYVAGSSLLGTGNGQISYAGGSPGGNPPGANTTLTAEAEASAPSAPNVVRFADPDADSGSVTFQLDPSQAVDLSAAGNTAKIEFDFVTTGGVAGRVSSAWRPLYSIDSNGLSQDYISNSHLAGIADGGVWFLNGGAVTGGSSLYSANIWYHATLTIIQRGGYYQYAFELEQIGGESLGLLGFGSIASTADAGRTWLTGLGMSLSSNLDEIVLIDNLSFTDATPPPVTGVLWASDNFDTYGTAGTNIFGQNNGMFEWLNGTGFGTGVILGHVRVNTTDVQSAPNSMEFLSEADGGNYRGELVLPDNALFIAAGDSVRLETDFKTLSGPGNRTSTALRALYSTNAFGAGEDFVSNDHIFGISDNGNWFLDSGDVLGPTIYQPDTWYHLALTIDRDPVTALLSHTLTISDIGTGTPLGTITNPGLGTAGRAFLTGLAISGSTNAGETTVFDNLEVRQLTPSPGPGTVMAQDDFDTYAAGSSLFGQSSGTITWSNGASSGLPVTIGSASIGNTDVQSAPNSLVFADPACPGCGSFLGQLPPTSAIELGPSRRARFRLDFKTTSGINGRVSLAFRLFFSSNEFGASQDWIDGRHVFGIADNGLWFCDNANGTGLISAVGGVRYDANTWYHLDCVVERPFTGPGQHTYRLELTDIVTGATLGVVKASGMTDAGRPWLTGVALYGSSNPDEITIIDNVAFEALDEVPPGPCPQDSFADINNDGFVDNDDLGVFMDCAFGPTLPFPAAPDACQCFDRDADDDIDQTDFAAFQRCLSFLAAADPACDDE